MKIINRSEFNLSHALEKEIKLKDGTIRMEQQPYLLPIGETMEVPDEVAKVWLKIKGVEKFRNEADIEAEKQKAVEEALAKQKAELQGKPKKAKK